MARFPGIAVAAITAMASAPLLFASHPEAAELFNDRCSACHSIGGGDLAGPDLVNAKKLTDDKLHAALVRMQDNVGPLTPTEMDTLSDLLKDPAAKDRIAGKAISAPPVEVGSAPNGRQFFFGERRLQNGGVACSACHAANGEGGSLAADLTAVHARLGDAGILGVAERPGFPAMKAAYTGHAMTHAEAVDVMAFLHSIASQAKPGSKPRAESTGVVHGAAAGIAVVFFAGVFVLFRSRPDRRLVRNPQR